MSDGGKGSAPRPFSVDRDTFASNWDRTFSGSGVTGSASVSTTEGSRSSLDSPAKPWAEFFEGLESDLERDEFPQSLFNRLLDIAKKYYD